MIMLYEIKHRFTGAVLFSLECGSLNICVETAISARANLTGAYLTGANLADANLADADLAFANLADAYLAGANLTDANLADANLADANLADANLARADLAGANLARAWIIDGGQDKRGFRFMASQTKEGSIQYRAGCKTWQSIDDARAYYGSNYTGDGDVAECLARLELLRGIAERRWPTPA